MPDKIITTRGISTTTLPKPNDFRFDKETRRLEMIYYYKYCLDNSLITVTGAQSRTTLIKKTFNHLGAAGLTGDIAMRTWLKGVIPSTSNDLYTLWLAYFAKYATVPDQEGITYSGLSVEAAYRKFLTDFVGGGTTPFLNNFIDPVFFSDSAVFKPRKVFIDTVTLSDLVSFAMQIRRSYGDTISLSDAMVIIQKKLFNDSLAVSDSTLVKLRKIFGDTVNLTDVMTRLVTFTRVIGDTATISDVVRYVLKMNRNDTVSISDAAVIRRGVPFADSISLSEIFTRKLTSNMVPNDTIDMLDVLLINLKKIISDTVVLSDAAFFSVGGYNQGNYNEGNYGR